MSRTAGWALFALVLLALILLPFFGFEGQMNAWSETLLRGHRPWWIAGPAVSLLLASDLFLPVPSSLVGAASGVLLGFAGGTLAAWIGMMAGCLAGYWVGANAGRAAVTRLLGPRELDRVSAAAARFGAWMIVLFRPVPVLAEASVVFAGAVRMPFRRFAALSALSNLGVSAAYAAVGAWSATTASFLLAFAGAVLFPGAAMLLSRTLEQASLRRRKHAAID